MQFFENRVEVEGRIKKRISFFYSVINSLTANHSAQTERINAEPSRTMYNIFITVESFFFISLKV